MNPLRLGYILLLAGILSTTVVAQKVLVVGVKRPETCAFATGPLIEDLKDVSFPKDWRIAIACTAIAWKELQRKGDAFATNTAYTNLKGRITILNGAIYQQPLPLRGTTRRTPKNVLRHELGHIVCQCGDEDKADHAAGFSDSAWLALDTPQIHRIFHQSSPS